MNPMTNVRIEKLTLNVGAGKDEPKLKKGILLLERVSEAKVIKTITTKRIPGWGVRPGLALGAKTTLRGPKVKALLVRLFESRENKLDENAFDDNGNVSFGITEYINIPGMKYDPDIGMLGFEASLTLGKPGFRIKKRRIKPKKIPSNHKVNKQDAIDFMKKEFGIQVGDKE